MTEKTGTIRTFLPRAPHPDSLADQRLSITDAGGTLLVHYDPRHRCAGIWYPAPIAKWTIFTPVSVEEFLAALPRLGVQIADGPALQKWLDAIAQAGMSPLAPPSALN